MLFSLKKVFPLVSVPACLIILFRFFWNRQNSGLIIKTHSHALVIWSQYLSGSFDPGFLRGLFFLPRQRENHINANLRSNRQGGIGLQKCTTHWYVARYQAFRFILWIAAGQRNKGFQLKIKSFHLSFLNHCDIPLYIQEKHSEGGPSIVRFNRPTRSIVD